MMPSIFPLPSSGFVTGQATQRRQERQALVGTQLAKPMLLAPLDVGLG
jgi:hypothetical protein